MTSTVALRFIAPATALGGAWFRCRLLFARMTRRVDCEGVHRVEDFDYSPGR